MTMTEPAEQAESAEEPIGDKLLEIPERYVPKYLSPSSASSFRECARRWKFRYVDRLPDPPGEAAVTGTFAHMVLEKLMQEPVENRTVDRAKKLARELWPKMENHRDYRGLELNGAVWTSARTAGRPSRGSGTWKTPARSMSLLPSKTYG